MAEAGWPRWPAGLLRVPSPALGPGGRLPPKVLHWRVAVVVTLILLLGLGRLSVSLGIIKVSSLRPVVATVAPGLLVGGTPSDADLMDLASDDQVDGVVNLAGPSVAEQATAASLHQAYLYLPLAPDSAPTLSQLRELAGFVRRYTAGGASVYLHDDVGGGRAVTTAAMLLLLGGRVWAVMAADITPAASGPLPGPQQLAIQQLWLALHPPAGHPPQQGNPYADARFDPW
jgi:hypothetical protein